MVSELQDKVQAVRKCRRNINLKVDIKAFSFLLFFSLSTLFILPLCLSLAPCLWQLVFCVHHSCTIQSIVTIALFKFWCQLFLTFVFNSLDKKSTFRYSVYANYVLSGVPIRYWNADRGWEVYFCDNVYLHFNLLHRSGVASTDTYKSIIQSWGFT